MRFIRVPRSLRKRARALVIRGEPRYCTIDRTSRVSQKKGGTLRSQLSTLNSDFKDSRTYTTLRSSILLVGVVYSIPFRSTMSMDMSLTATVPSRESTCEVPERQRKRKSEDQPKYSETTATASTWEEDTGCSDDESDEEEYEYSFFDEDVNLPAEVEGGQELRFNTDPVSCPVCFTTADSGAAVTLPCKHSFCIECLQQYIQAQISEGKANNIKCLMPAKECGTQIDHQALGEILDLEAQEKLKKFGVSAFRLPSLPHAGLCKCHILPGGTSYCGLFHVQTGFLSQVWNESVSYRSDVRAMGAMVGRSGRTRTSTRTSLSKPLS
jgi:hypothetical protein